MRITRPIVLTAFIVAMGPFAQIAAGLQEPAPPPVIGRWDITVTASGTTYPSWLEVHKSGYRTLAGQFVGQSGSARPVSRVEFTDGKLSFSVPPQ